MKMHLESDSNPIKSIKKFTSLKLTQFNKIKVNI